MSQKGRTDKIMDVVGEALRSEYARGWHEGRTMHNEAQAQAVIDAAEAWVRASRVRRDAEYSWHRGVEEKALVREEKAELAFHEALFALTGWRSPSAPSVEEE